MNTIKTILYWFISWTWGFIMTFLGAIVALILIARGHKPKRFHYNIYFEFGEDWGGINLGAFFFVNKGATNCTKAHEAGHGLQNLMFGPLFPFVIGIPSLIRCQWREFIVKHRGVTRLPDYDAIWFERNATNYGYKYFIVEK